MKNESAKPAAGSDGATPCSSRGSADEKTATELRSKRHIFGTSASKAKWWDKHLPKVHLGGVIPKIVHQVCLSQPAPPALMQGIEQARRDNVGWEFRLYNDYDAEAFIMQNYGEYVLKLYQRIRPEYGAARADLFRYLLVYQLGGVYLDIKSRFTKPIDSVINGDECFIISQWNNAPGEEHEGMGLQKDLKHVDGGEFQQWHVIATAGHPFLRAAIISVLCGVETYSPWRTSVGRIGVLRLTGPIAYTLAIRTLLSDHPHRFINNNSEIGLKYSAYQQNELLQSKHYSTLTMPIVRGGIARLVSDPIFNLALWIKRRLQN